MALPSVSPIHSRTVCGNAPPRKNPPDSTRSAISRRSRYFNLRPDRRGTCIRAWASRPHSRASPRVQSNSISSIRAAFNDNRRLNQLTVVGRNAKRHCRPSNDPKIQQAARSACRGGKMPRFTAEKHSQHSQGSRPDPSCLTPTSTCRPNIDNRLTRWGLPFAHSDPDLRI